MRIQSTVLSSLAAALIAAGALPVQAADAPYYNPANAASSSGQTSGYELYQTIGCPGRGILDAPCAGPVAAKPAAPVVEKPAPVVQVLDSDGDGVADDKDRCPGTPMGAKVDALGCELDGDKDGVVDRLDKCPTTPAGRKVNAQGCELDGDGDGVVDALDKCPTTSAGRTVNAEGCELDGDGDGVVDALDKCPTTPAGNRVNSQGCDLDTDGDGVIDSADQCPTTPAGERVDAKGCSLPKVINLDGVNFDNNDDALRPAVAAILDAAVATLKRYPGLQVEVAGHTDSTSSDAHNLDLSQRRAQAVMDYFISKGVKADSLSAKGYGEVLPIADNATAEGRFKNRRVELRILN
ncbi:MAG: OmpA family protein [Pseudomonadota bacterium]|nr:OmpA family protein [Pseudomonadota bacterium]